MERSLDCCGGHGGNGDAGIAGGGSSGGGASGRYGLHFAHGGPPGSAVQPKMEAPELLPAGKYLVLDGLQDPGNVGTIWRTADALGADGLLLVNGCADPWNWKTVRATMGACFRLPVWEVTSEKLPGLLERSGLPLYATALR